MFGFLRKKSTQAFCFVSSAVATSPTFAAIDISGVQAELQSATDSGQEVGGYVIAAAIGIVAVGIILSVVRKA